MIDKHGGAILADLRHEYGFDLRDLFSEVAPESPRYVLNLIVHLPKDSAFYASRLGGQHFRGWNEDRVALAEMVDLLKAGNHYFLMANRNPDKPKPKAPTPFPRPVDSDTKPAAPKPGSFAAMVVAAKRAQRMKREQDG